MVGWSRWKASIGKKTPTLNCPELNMRRNPGASSTRAFGWTLNMLAPVTWLKPRARRL
jgi:hypothetical protein